MDRWIVSPKFEHKAYICLCINRAMGNATMREPKEGFSSPALARLFDGLNNNFVQKSDGVQQRISFHFGLVFGFGSRLADSTNVRLVKAHLFKNRCRMFSGSRWIYVAAHDRIDFVCLYCRWTCMALHAQHSDPQHRSLWCVNEAQVRRSWRSRKWTGPPLTSIALFSA
jgi:hypothetical protein